MMRRKIGKGEGGCVKRNKREEEKKEKGVGG